jgi:hypothetical protein
MLLVYCKREERFVHQQKPSLDLQLMAWWKQITLAQKCNHLLILLQFSSCFPSVFLDTFVLLTENVTKGIDALTKEVSDYYIFVLLVHCKTKCSVGKHSTTNLNCAVESGVVVKRYYDVWIIFGMILR